MLMSFLSLGVCALFLYVVVAAADSRNKARQGVDMLIIAGLCMAFFIYRCWVAA